jgi:hypothetical protein
MGNSVDSGTSGYLCEVPRSLDHQNYSISKRVSLQHPGWVSTDIGQVSRAFRGGGEPCDIRSTASADCITCRFDALLFPNATRQRRRSLKKRCTAARQLTWGCAFLQSMQTPQTRSKSRRGNGPVTSPSFEREHSRRAASAMPD